MSQVNTRMPVGKMTQKAKTALFASIVLGGWEHHTIRRTCTNGIQLKNVETVDSNEVQERIDSAQKRRDLKNAKRLLYKK